MNTATDEADTSVSSRRPRIAWLPLAAIVAAIVATFYLAVREPDVQPERVERVVAPLGSLFLGEGAAHLSALINKQEDLILVGADQPHAYAVNRADRGFAITQQSGEPLVTVAITGDDARDAQRIRDAVYVDVRRLNPSAFPDVGHLQPEVLRQVLSAEQLMFDWRAGVGVDWDRYRFMLTTATVQQPLALVAHERLADFFTERGAALYGLEEARVEASKHLEQVIDLTPKRYGYLMQRARYYLVLELDYRSARDVLQRGRMRNPDAAPNVFGLTQIAVREGRIGDARELLAGAENYFAPRRTAWLAAFARLAVVTGDYERALELANLAAAEATEFRTRIEAMITAAEAAHLSGDPEGARALLARLPADLGPEMRSLSLPVRIALDEAGVVPGDLGGSADAGRPDPYLRARVAAAAGQTDVVLEAIETGLQLRDERLLDSLRVARYWGSVRSEPQFAVLLKTLTAMETRSVTPGTGP